jgi:deoxyribonuclease V
VTAQPFHGWDLEPGEAVALQERLRERAVREDRLGVVRHVAGVDVGYAAGDRVMRAAVAVLNVPQLELVASATAVQPVRFPYLPGLLSFRETPAVLEAFSQLPVAPDLVLYDGHGLAHPRRFGVATHVGLLLDLPCIGVAKTRLVGEHGRVPAGKGECAPLVDRGEVIGTVLRTRAGVKPLFVSVGHRISLTTAVRYVMTCVTRYRLPETTRWAHRLASGDAPHAGAALEFV